MGYSVEGKICLVTGSARGLGREFARRLLELGGKVCISDVNEATGMETKQHFEKEYGDSNVTFCL